LVSEGESPGMTVWEILEIRCQEAIMNKDQFKGRTRQAKGRVSEISGKLFRDKLLEKKGWAQKIGSRIQAGYDDFMDDIQGYNDLEDDIRGYGDFRDDLQKSG
jgi:uncharacterized protein YjbJ (UPF0337 family)